MSEEKNGKDQLNLTVTEESSRRFRQMCLDNRLKMNEQFELWIEREWKLRNAEPGPADKRRVLGAKA